MSKHMMDNYTVTQWVRITDCALFNQVPFGIYAISEPTDMIPPSSIVPHEYDRTVYFGKSGISYNDFFYDRKSVKKKVNVVDESIYEKSYFHIYSLPARRIKTHRHNFTNKNANIDREVSYTKFFEKFGSGEDVVSKVNVCMITPLYEIPNHSVKAWLSAMESYFILRFQYNFGRNTLMNIDHSYEHNNRVIEDSHAQVKKQEVRETSLVDYFV